MASPAELERLTKPTILIEHDSVFESYVNNLKNLAEGELQRNKTAISQATSRSVVEMLRRCHVEMEIQTGKKAWDWVFFYSYKSLVGCLDYLRPHKQYNTVSSDVRFTVNLKSEAAADIVETQCSGELQKLFNSRKTQAIQVHNKILKDKAEKKAAWDVHEAEMKQREDERLKKGEARRQQEELANQERAKRMIDSRRQEQIQKRGQQRLEALRWTFASAVPIAGSPIARVGLPNLGNTCYMNSVMQLLQVSRLANMLTKTQIPVAQHNSMGSKGLVTNTVRQLFVAMSGGGQAMYKAPVHSLIGNFKNVIQQRYELFSGNQQQCAGEFLTVLLDNLHEDANLARNIPGVNPRRLEVDSSQTVTDSELLLNSKKSVVATDASPIFDLFSYQEMSLLGCSICGASSRTVNSRMGIELDLQKGVPKTTLDSCIKGYLSQEYLGTADTWTCSGCGHRSHAMKQLQLHSPPPVLSIILKRFGGLGSTSHKNKIEVAFPKELDLSEYFKEEYLTIYDLVGIVNHLGETTTSGHYTADVLGRDNRWFSISDDKCSPSQGSPNFSTAYILLFQKKSVKIPRISNDVTTGPSGSQSQLLLVGTDISSVMDPLKTGKVISLNYDTMQHEVRWADGITSFHSGNELQRQMALPVVPPAAPFPVVPTVAPVAPVAPFPVVPTVAPVAPLPEIPKAPEIPMAVPVAPVVVSSKFVSNQIVVFTNRLDMKTSIVTIISVTAPGLYSIRLPSGEVKDALEADLRIPDAVDVSKAIPPPAKPTPPMSFSNGDNLIYFDSQSGHDVPVTVVKVDHMMQPPGYVIKLPDGGERSTESNRLRHFEDVMPSVHRDPLFPPPPASAPPPPPTVSAFPPPPPVSVPPPPPAQSQPGDDIVLRITALSDKLENLKQQLSLKKFNPEMLTAQQEVESLCKDVAATVDISEQLRSTSTSILEALTDQARTMALEGRMLQLQG